MSDYVHSTIKDNSIKFGGVISYSCNDNYVLVDGSTGGVISEWESSRTCQESGQLTGTEPRCAGRLGRCTSVVNIYLTKCVTKATIRFHFSK